MIIKNWFIWWNIYHHICFFLSFVAPSSFYQSDRLLFIYVAFSFDSGSLHSMSVSRLLPSYLLLPVFFDSLRIFLFIFQPSITILHSFPSIYVGSFLWVYLVLFFSHLPLLLLFNYHLILLLIFQLITTSNSFVSIHIILSFVSLSLPFMNPFSCLLRY